MDRVSNDGYKSCRGLRIYSQALLWNYASCRRRVRALRSLSDLSLALSSNATTLNHLIRLRGSQGIQIWKQRTGSAFQHPCCSHINPTRACPARWSKIPSACCVSMSVEDRTVSIRAAATSLYERCVACLSSTSDSSACRTWPELATPLPRCRSVATCGRPHLCFRGAQASGRVLTSVRRTWLGASELQPNNYLVHTTHSALVRVESFPARGVPGVCDAYASGA